MDTKIQAIENLSPGKIKLLELKKKLEAKKLEEKKIVIKAKPKPKVIIKRISLQEVYDRKIKSIPVVPDNPVELKILTPKEEVVKAGWNKHLPSPLTKDEKVIVLKKQDNVPDGYVKVLHGEPGHKITSIMSIDHFNKEDGSQLFWKHRSKYIRMYMYLSGKLKAKLEPDDTRFSSYTIQRLVPSDYRVKKKRISA